MINEVPNPWESCTIGELAELVRGVSYKKPDATNKPTAGYSKLLRANNIDGNINFDDLIYVDDARISDSQRLQAGDVLIAMSSGSKHLVGKAAQVVEPRASTFGAFCGALRPSTEIDPKFFGFFFQTQAYRKGVSEASKGSNINNLKRDHITEVVFPLAPLNEQRRIVEKIDTLFARLDKGEEAVREVQKLLTRYRQSVLKSAVTGQLTADWRAQREGQLEHGGELLERILEERKTEWSGRGKYAEPQKPDLIDLHALPEEWVWASMDQLANVIGGLTKNSKRKELPLRRPMLRVANVYQNRLELDDVHETGVTEQELARVLLEPRDLLVVEGNGSKDQIGRMAVWSGEISNAVHQNHLIKVRLFEKALAEFLVTWFQSMMGRQIVEKVASSTSGLYTLSISKIKALVAPLPSLEEIAEIMVQVDDAFTKIDKLERWCETELKRSASLRQSILKDAFAGCLVSQDPNDEPASALLARIAAEKAPTKKTRRKVSA